MVTDRDIRQHVSFERDASAVLQHLRGAIAEAIEELPEAATKATDLHRNLRLDMMLSWRLFKVAGAPSPLAAGPHVPSPANMRTFLTKIAEQGVRESLIKDVADATKQFEALIDAHAGDRATFDSMVSSLVVDGDEAAKLHLRHKRAAFRAQRHLLGGQAKTHFMCWMLKPANKPQMLDCVRVEGLIDLRQFRNDARMVISRPVLVNDDGSPRGAERRPIDPTGETEHGIAILREFSSDPLPELETSVVCPGRADCRFAGMGIGTQASITCIEGHVASGAVQRYQATGNLFGEHGLQIRIPCEVAILDLLIQRGTFTNFRPICLAVSTHLGESFPCNVEKGGTRLPFDETVTCLGQGPSVLHTPDVPRYTQLGRYVFDQVGWDGEQFDVYRCRIEYPVMPSTVAIRFDLPEAPRD